MYRCLLVLSLFLSTSVYSEWTNLTQVAWVRAYPGSATGHYIALVDKSINEGCSITVSGGVVYLDDSGGRVYTAVLAAVMAGKEIKFSLKGCTHNGYAKVVEVHVPK